MGRWLVALLMLTSTARAEVREITISSTYFLGKLPELIMRRDHLIERHAAALGIPDLNVRWITPGGHAQNDVESGTLSFGEGAVFELLQRWAKTRGTPDAVLGVTGVWQTIIDDKPVNSDIVWTTQRFASDNPRIVQAVFDAYADLVDTINRDKAAAADLFGTWSHYPPNRQIMFSMLTEPTPNNTGHVIRTQFTQTPAGVMFWAREFARRGATIPDMWTDVFLPIAHGLAGS